MYVDTKRIQVGAQPCTKLYVYVHIHTKQSLEKSSIHVYIIIPALESTVNMCKSSLDQF